MVSMRTPLDYMNAVRTAAQGDLSRYPAAVRSVLAAKFYHGLGPRLHSLFGLMDVPRERWDEYLVDESLRVILRRINQPVDRDVVNDKLKFYEHCVENALSTIPVLWAIDREGGSRWKSFVTVENEDEWGERLRGAPDHLFIKLIDGTWGMDALVAHKYGDQWIFDGSVGSATDFYSFLAERLGSRRGWLVQPQVTPHREIKEIASRNGLPTIRATTCLVDKKVHVLFAALRIPVGDNITDNFSHGASGNLIAPIYLETGVLGSCRGSTNTAWPNIVEVEVHPDTGNAIRGFSVPMWEEVLDLLARGQGSLPNLSTLGWDIAVTDSEPVIVEANATYDVDLIQVAQREGVGPKLARFLRL